MKININIVITGISILNFFILIGLVSGMENGGVSLIKGFVACMLIIIGNYVMFYIADNHRRLKRQLKIILRNFKTAPDKRLNMHYTYYSK